MTPSPATFSRNYFRSKIDVNFNSNCCTTTINQNNTEIFIINLITVIIFKYNYCDFDWSKYVGSKILLYLQSQSSFSLSEFHLCFPLNMRAFYYAIREEEILRETHDESTGRMSPRYIAIGHDRTWPSDTPFLRSNSYDKRPLFHGHLLISKTPFAIILNESYEIMYIYFIKNSRFYFGTATINVTL